MVTVLHPVMEWRLWLRGTLVEAKILCMGIFEAMSALIRMLEDQEFPIKPSMLASSPCFQPCASFVTPEWYWPSGEVQVKFLLWFAPTTVYICRTVFVFCLFFLPKGCSMSYSVSVMNPTELRCALGHVIFLPLTYSKPLCHNKPVVLTLLFQIWIKPLHYRLLHNAHAILLVEV